MFDQIQFPQIKRVYAKTIATELVSVQPLSAPSGILDGITNWSNPIASYKNYWGETVHVYGNGSKSIQNDKKKPIYRYGDVGHSFIHGFYIIDENGEPVYAGDPRYDEIRKNSSYWKVLQELKVHYSEPDFSIEKGRGEKLVINDKAIKGIRIYHGMELDKNTIDSFIKIIDEEIRKGRIRAGVFGTWKTEISLDEVLKKHENSKA